MKKKATLEQYMQVGAKFRVLNLVLLDAMCGAGSLLTKKDMGKFRTACKTVSFYQSLLDDKLHEELSVEYRGKYNLDISNNDLCDVFYGSPKLEPRKNRIDLKMSELIAEYANNITYHNKREKRLTSNEKWRVNNYATLIIIKDKSECLCGACYEACTLNSRAWADVMFCPHCGIHFANSKTFKSYNDFLKADRLGKYCWSAEEEL